MYAWASPDYLLDHLSFDTILMYHDYGVEWEEQKANILTGRLAVGLFGAKEKPKVKRGGSSDRPDRAAFYKRHAKTIKRPEGGEV